MLPKKCIRVILIFKTHLVEEEVFCRIDDESFDGRSEREVLVPGGEVHERGIPMDDALCDPVEYGSLPVVVGVDRGGEEQLDDRIAVEGKVGRVSKVAVVRTVQNVHEVIRVTVIPSPSKQTQGVLSCLGPFKIRRPVDLEKVNSNIHRGKIALDRFADFHRVEHVRTAHRHHPKGGVESLGVSCLRKELPGHVRVVGVVLDVVVVAEHVWWHPVDRDVRGPLGEGDDCGFVDRVVDCLSYFPVGERGGVPWCLDPRFAFVVSPVCVGVVVPVPVVHGEEPDVHAWSDEQREVLVCLDVVEGRGVGILHALNGVVLELLESRGGIRDDFEDEGINPQWWTVPVLQVLRQGDVVVWEPFDELEGPGAAGVLVRVCSPVLCIGGADDRRGRHRKAGKD